MTPVPLFWDGLQTNPGLLPSYQQRMEDVPSSDHVAQSVAGVLDQTEGSGNCGLGKDASLEVCTCWWCLWHSSVGWLHLPPNCMKTSFSKRSLDMFWASLVAQLVKNLPAIHKTLIQFLGWEDPLEKQ